MTARKNSLPRVCICRCPWTIHKLSADADNLDMAQLQTQLHLPSAYSVVICLKQQLNWATGLREARRKVPKAQKLVSTTCVNHRGPAERGQGESRVLSRVEKNGFGVKTSQKPRKMEYGTFRLPLHPFLTLMRVWWASRKTELPEWGCRHIHIVSVKSLCCYSRAEVEPAAVISRLILGYSLRTVS